MVYQLVGNCVVSGTARFCALSNGLMRLERSPTGQFEDRPTVVVFTRPQAVPFQRIETTEDGVLHLYTEFIHLVYRADSEPLNNSNLQIHWHCGDYAGTWMPSLVDTKNLGGTFTSLDLIHREFLPQGVHPASVMDDYPHTQEWLYTPLKSIHQYLRDRGETTRFEEPPLWYLDRFRPEDLPEAMQEFLEQWHHFPPGVLSLSGYHVLNDSQSAPIADQGLSDRADQDCQDWYFFAYGRNYIQALQDFVQLCGRIPMLPRWAFGVWFSLYDQMHDDDYRQLISTFKEWELPLDVLVLDVDWHLSGWCGWDWNRDLFPNPQAFLQWAHQEAGLHIGANVHVEGVPPTDSQFAAMCEARGLDPEAVKAGEVFAVKNPKADWIFESWQPEETKGTQATTEEWDEGWLLVNLAEQEEAKLFMQMLHSPREEDGIEFWWIDGANATHGGVNKQLWTNHVYYTHLEAKTNTRAVILSRAGGVGSHRYPVQFSADTYSHWEVLQFLVDFTAQAGNVGVAYWSHDLGGFFGHVPGVSLIDPELLVRWVQFGCWSPIVRLHSDHGRREPWLYGRWVLEAVRKALATRRQLIPYLYHLSRVAYDTGLPLCRPLYLAYPEDKEAYLASTEYMLGNHILVAPVVEAGGYRSVYLPEGAWWERSTHQFFSASQYLDWYAPLNQIPVFLRAGAILPLAPASLPVGTAAPDTLLLEVYAGGEGELDFYEDDGISTAYRTDRGSDRLFTQRSEGESCILSCQAVRGSYEGMPAKRNFQIQWIGLAPNSFVEVSGVENKEVRWLGKVLEVMLLDVPQSASWQVRVMG
ncbi:MAG: DUF5110 domain-containing protein [Kastovskya adunca ATA6-11-RM4]|nr:DUF5110 domain-containing protein [Kastovskya adunca ATA6-11-RM4]